MAALLLLLPQAALPGLLLATLLQSGGAGGCPVRGCLAQARHARRCGRCWTAGQTRHVSLSSRMRCC